MAASSRRLSSLLSRSPFFPCLNSNVQDKDQVFGPGQTISQLKDFDERAKKSPYGLPAGVLRRNTATTEYSCMLSNVNKHPLGVNCFDAAIPFGGYNKMSGIGMGKGIDCLNNYLEEKGVSKNVSQIVAYSPKEQADLPFSWPWFSKQAWCPTGGSPSSPVIVAPTFAGISSAFLGWAFIFAPLVLNIPQRCSSLMHLLGLPVVSFSFAYLLGTFDYIVGRFTSPSWIYRTDAVTTSALFVAFCYYPYLDLAKTQGLVPLGLLGIVAFPVLVYLLATADYDLPRFISEIKFPSAVGMTAAILGLGVNVGLGIVAIKKNDVLAIFARRTILAYLCTLAVPAMVASGFYLTYTIKYLVERYFPEQTHRRGTQSKEMDD